MEKVRGLILGIGEKDITLTGDLLYGILDIIPQIVYCISDSAQHPVAHSLNACKAYAGLYTVQHDHRSV